MARKNDPVARVLDGYRALTEPEKMAADYLLARERKGEALVIGTPRRGRPVGSRNKAGALPLVERNEALPSVLRDIVNAANPKVVT